MLTKLHNVLGTKATILSILAFLVLILIGLFIYSAYYVFTNTALDKSLHSNLRDQLYLNDSKIDSNLKFLEKIETFKFNLNDLFNFKLSSDEMDTLDLISQMKYYECRSLGIEVYEYYSKQESYVKLEIMNYELDKKINEIDAANVKDKNILEDQKWHMNYVNPSLSEKQLKDIGLKRYYYFSLTFTEKIANKYLELVKKENDYNKNYPDREYFSEFNGINRKLKISNNELTFKKDNSLILFDQLCTEKNKKTNSLKVDILENEMKNFNNHLEKIKISLREENKELEEKSNKIQLGIKSQDEFFNNNNY